MIRVNFRNAPGYNSDWICIVPAGSPDTEPGDYKYMPGGVGQGSLMFDPRAPGRYEVRVYYNYRRNGYVVSGRYPFSVGNVSVTEEASTQPMESIEPGNSPEADFPPPIAFDEPPNVVVLPGTDVYIVPDAPVDIFFQGGWWWRQWRGNWYRSQFYNRGWAHYHEYPSWHRKIPHDWRHSYNNHVWGGRPWNPPLINHGNLNNHWRGGQWRRDHGFGRPDSRPRWTVRGGGAAVVPETAVDPAVDRDKPGVRTGGPGGGRPGGGPDKPGVRTAVPAAAGPAVVPTNPEYAQGGPGGGRPGGGPDKSGVRTGGPGGGTHSDRQMRQSHGDGSGRGDRR